MNKTFNLLFIIKKNKIRKNGTAPIYLRITIDGKVSDIAAKRYIGLVSRTVLATKPITVEYELTAYSESLNEMITIMYEWGKKHREKVVGGD